MQRRLEQLVNMLAFPLNTMPLATCSILFFIFAVLRLYVSVQPLLVLFSLIGAVLIILKHLRKTTTFVTIFILTGMILSIVVTSNHILFSEQSMKNFDRCYARVEGRIKSFPDNSTDKSSFYVDCDKVYSNEGAVGENIQIFVKTENAGYKFGDRIIFNGYLTQTENSYSKYYMAKGAMLRASDITLISKKEGGILSKALVYMRGKAVEASEMLFKDEVKMLFRAIVAGDKTSFSDEFSNALTKSGISHIACVSGLHVSLIGMGIYILLQGRRKLAFAGAFSAVLLFTVFTGATPSTMRAAMMFTVFLLSKISIRQNDSFTALSLSAAVLVAINPYVVFDWGFILSFLSVLGIEIFSADFAKWLRFLPRFVRESVSVTISAQLMTVPALTIMFGNISIYAIFSNIIVSVVFTYALYLSLIFAFIASVPLLGYVCGVLCTFLLDIVCVTAVFFADLPYSFMGIKSFNATEIVCYYFVVLLFVFREKIPFKSFCTVAIITSLVLLGNFMFAIPKEGEYPLGENSYVYISKDFSKLVLNDDAENVKKEIISGTRSFDVDYIVLNDTPKGEENEIFGLYEIVNAEKIYVNEKYCDASFLNLANSRGVNVKKYSED